MKWLLLAALAVTTHAWADNESAGSNASGNGKWSLPVKVAGTIDGKKHTAAMLVYLPTGYANAPAKKFPLVIALHGWGHTPAQLRDKGQLARWADTYGFVVAVPAMGKTIYETKLYPDSTRAWGPVPGARWVGEVVLPYVREKYSVHSDRANTAVIGYSTGGRGALLLAALYPEFRFAGSASGTFDLMRLDPKTGEYKIHAVVYGPRDKFQDRWVLDNNISPHLLAKLAGTKLFIAHGKKDRSVPHDQIDALRDALATQKGIEAEFASSPEGGHDWPYWNAQWQPMFGAMAAALELTAK